MKANSYFSAQPFLSSHLLLSSSQLQFALELGQCPHQIPKVLQMTNYAFVELSLSNILFKLFNLKSLDLVISPLVLLSDQVWTGRLLMSFEFTTELNSPLLTFLPSCSYRFLDLLLLFLPHVFPLHGLHPQKSRRLHLRNGGLQTHPLNRPSTRQGWGIL